MSAPKKDWTPSRWEIRTASCAITLMGTVGGAMLWQCCVLGERMLVSGQFLSSGTLNTDLKTAQSAAIDALNAYAKTVTSYAAEIAAL